MAAGWDDTPAAAVDGGWQADPTPASNHDVTGGFAPEDVSMHAHGTTGDAAGDGGCRM